MSITFSIAPIYKESMDQPKRYYEKNWRVRTLLTTCGRYSSSESNRKSGNLNFGGSTNLRRISFQLFWNWTYMDLGFLAACKMTLVILARFLTDLTMPPTVSSVWTAWNFPSVEIA